MKELTISIALLLSIATFTFANEADDKLKQQLKEDIGSYIVECGYEDDGFVDAVVDICYGEFGHDPWIYVMVGFFESRWRCDVVGSANEIGWVQVHPCHNACKVHGFTTNKLSWKKPQDVLRVACMMVQERLDEGKTMYRAFRPWTTRTKGWVRYERYHGKRPQKDGKLPKTP